MPIRREEQRSAERFQKWLFESGRKSDWEPVERDPPDLCFTVDLERWAVEVTGLFQYAEWNGKEKNIKNIEVPLELMCDSLLQAIKPGATLDYGLSVSAPFKSNWQVLENRALEFINSKSTKEGSEGCLDAEEAIGEFAALLNDESGDPIMESVKQALILQHGKVMIRAMEGSGKVFPLPMLDVTSKVPGEKTMIADIMASLGYSVDRILDAKLPRLRKITGYDRKLILIWPDYFFADIERVAELLSERQLTSADVDSIVLIESGSRIGCVADPSGLFSKS